MKRAIQAALAALVVLAAPVARAASMHVNMNNVNVRSGPGTNRAIVGHLGLNAPVETLAHVNGWTRVRLANGRVGWVDSTFLSKVVPLQARTHKYRAGRFERAALAKQYAGMVWFDTATKLYHHPKYGPTAHGGYMPVAQARRLGGHQDPKYPG